MVLGVTTWLAQLLPACQVCHSLELGAQLLRCFVETQCDHPASVFLTSLLWVCSEAKIFPQSLKLSLVILYLGSWSLWGHLKEAH